MSEDRAESERRGDPQDDTLLLERKASGLSDKEVGSLDQVLEVGNSLRVPELRDVGDVDRLGTSSARHEDVGLVAEVSAVAEVGSIGDDFSSCTK